MDMGSICQSGKTPCCHSQPHGLPPKLRRLPVRRVARQTVVVQLGGRSPRNIFCKTGCRCSGALQLWSPVYAACICDRNSGILMMCSSTASSCITSSHQRRHPRYTFVWGMLGRMCFVPIPYFRLSIDQLLFRFVLLCHPSPGGTVRVRTPSQLGTAPARSKTRGILSTFVPSEWLS